MGSNMVRRLLKQGHQCVVLDRSSQAVAELVDEHAAGAADLRDLVQKPRRSPRMTQLCSDRVIHPKNTSCPPARNAAVDIIRAEGVQVP